MRVSQVKLQKSQLKVLTEQITIDEIEEKFKVCLTEYLCGAKKIAPDFQFEVNGIKATFL